jgi:hypothetical protein
MLQTSELPEAATRHVATAVVWERGMTGTVRSLRRELRDTAANLRAATRTPTARVVFKLIAVLAAVALLVVVFGPRLRDFCNEPKADATRAKIMNYADEAFPIWSTSHPDRECPASLGELNEYTNHNDSNDAWGRPLELHCDAVDRSSPIRLWIRSAGPDRRFNTDDDIDNLQ